MIPNEFRLNWPRSIADRKKEKKRRDGNEVVVEWDVHHGCGLKRRWKLGIVCLVVKYIRSFDLENWLASLINKRICLSVYLIRYNTSRSVGYVCVLDALITKYSKEETEILLIAPVVLLDRHNNTIRKFLFFKAWTNPFVDDFWHLNEYLPTFHLAIFWQFKFGNSKSCMHLLVPSMPVRIILFKNYSA
jgi:hypothetical protein